MIKRIFLVAILVSLFLVPGERLFAAEIRVHGEQVLELKSPPLDAAISLNGKWMYVLSGEGDLLVYSGDGRLSGRVAVNEPAGRIRVGPREDVVLLINPTKNAVRVLTLDFIKEINTEGSPFKGPKDAPVVITEFTEFQCPHCAALAPVLGEIHRKYPDQVKIVFKNYPLKSHSFSFPAAAAAMAAERQDAFWRLHDRLFDLHNSLSYEKVRDAAGELGLDQERLIRDMRDPQIMNRIKQDIEDARQAGVMGVPAVFINGRHVKDRSPAGFVSMIEEEILKAIASK
jgi:protein-disulfide isomerase